MTHGNSATSRDGYQAAEEPAARPSQRPLCLRPAIAPTAEQNEKSRDAFSTRGSKREQTADRARRQTAGGRSRGNSRADRRPGARANRDRKLPDRAWAHCLWPLLFLATASRPIATRWLGQFRFRAKRYPPDSFRNAGPKLWNRSRRRSGGG